MNSSVLLTILACILIVGIIILIMAVRSTNRHIEALAFCMHEIHKSVSQQRYIDKNLENFKIGSLKYILIGTRLYISAIMEKSIMEERYEDAQQCKNAIKEISKLIDF